MMIRFFVWQLLLALDQLVNVLFGGYADETMSSRAYRMSQRHDTSLFGWRWRVCATIINGLFFDRNHCRDAFMSERDNLQLPPEFRNRNEKI